MHMSKAMFQARGPQCTGETCRGLWPFSYFCPLCRHGGFGESTEVGMAENVCLKKKDHDLPIYTLPHANCHTAFMYTVNILGNTVNRNVSSRSHTMHITSEYMILFVIMFAYFLRTIDTGTCQKCRNGDGILCAV